jgi:hypothetical protein
VQSRFHGLARARLRPRGPGVAHRGASNRLSDGGVGLELSGADAEVAQEVLDAAEFAGGAVRSLVTGRAQVLTVGNFFVATGAERLLVVELLGREAAVSVVRAPTGGALTRTARALTREALNRFGKTHEYLLRHPTFARTTTETKRSVHVDSTT